MTSKPAIRVLRIISRLNTGGPARHCLILAGRLNPERFQTMLVTGAVDASGGEEEFTETEPGRHLSRGVMIERIAGLGRSPSPRADLGSLSSLVEVCRRFRPHLVHTHTSKAGALGRVAARMASLAPGGPPPAVLVHTFHGHVFHGYFGPLGNAAVVTTERLLARLTHRFVTLSERLRQEICQALRLRPQRVSIVPLGLDLAPLLSQDRQPGLLQRELGWPEERPLIGAVGRLAPIKAFDKLLDALALMGNGPGSPGLVIAGDGAERPRLEERARQLGIAPRVAFLGFRHDLQRIYPSLDVLAVSSRNEGTPVAIIEAFAAACPVVATAVGGVPDLFVPQAPSAQGLQDCAEGVLVSPPAEPTSLARALASLLADPQRCREAGLQARRQVRERFAAQRLVTDTEALYEELLSAHPSLAGTAR